MLGKPSFIAHRAAVGHLARVFCPPKPMFYATEQLRRRLRLSNLDLIEAPGQDGRSCQYLAIIHQLTLHGVLSLHLF